MEGVVLNKYTLSQSNYYWSLCSETAVPITGKHDSSSSTNVLLYNDDQISKVGEAIYDPINTTLFQFKF